KEPVELNALLRSTLQTIQGRFMAHARQVVVDLPEEPIYVDGDPLRLEQTFGNLLSNALKFTGERGHVWLSAQRAPPSSGGDGNDGKSSDGVIVRVRDDGIGIDPSAAKRVFDMFVQLDRSPGR